MDKTIEAICDALDAISTAVMNSTTEDRTLLETSGWNFPAVSRHDLALIPTQISDRLRGSSAESIAPDLQARLKGLAGQISLIQGATVPYIYNGNGATAVPAYISSFVAIEKMLEPILSWQVPDSNTLPSKLVRRLRTINAQLDELIPDKDVLQGQIEKIKSATEAADSLPVDLQELDLARKRIEKAAASSEALFSKITDHEKQSKTSIDEISDRNVEAQALVESCEEAYRITTTKGLSASFQQKATSLSRSVWAWVFFLFVALGIGSTLGYHRIGAISEALSQNDPKLGALWLQFALSALSVGAPLWFAWLATKQIGQRFRLAEDYAFKASIAKAYEGYRREAARIDPELEKRLFASALDRLDEAPLRLVEQSSHGGPWSEFLDSKVVASALDKYPEFRDQIYALGRKAVETLSVNDSTRNPRNNRNSSGANAEDE